MFKIVVFRSSPRKTDLKLSEEKTDSIKTDKAEDKEGQVLSLPPPEPMPKDEEGNAVDLRIPVNLNSQDQLSSLEFLVNRFIHCLIH